MDWSKQGNPDHPPFESVCSSKQSLMRLQLIGVRFENGFLV